MREAERRASSIVPYWKLPDGTKEFDKHMTVLDGVLTSCGPPAPRTPPCLVGLSFVSGGSSTSIAIHIKGPLNLL